MCIYNYQVSKAINFISCITHKVDISRDVYLCPPVSRISQKLIDRFINLWPRINGLDFVTDLNLDRGSVFLLCCHWEIWHSSHSIQTERVVDECLQHFLQR